ncbi:MAG TPA: ATP-binding protein [Casimicrobiaceae bacterium]|nr:ATP-binding protein [Casimicrobiaceae bacterium]
MSSIRRELLFWLLLVLLLAVAAAAVGTYLRARVEANALFDHQLQAMAASLTDAPFAPVEGIGSGAGELIVQIWDRNGVRLYISQPRSALPQNARLGFTDVHTDQGDWRVFSTLSGNTVVQVAQPMRARGELAASMALRTIVPLLVMLPLLAVTIWLVVDKGFRPLERVAAAVAKRSPTALEPLPERGLPTEVTPLVGALNALLERLREALSAQRTFIADAAHELRTPLTAVHLQAQLAERAATAEERRSALTDLKAGLERATRLSEQLLALAREEPGVAEKAFAPVDLEAIARDAIQAFAPLAAAKAIDLGLVDPPPQAPAPIVSADADALSTLVSNLIDNAVRYTPQHGRVDVAIAADPGAVLLTVRDTGSGVPETERSRIFDRFFRGARGQGAVRGSGLGLAIVKRIAERHGATIALGAGLDGRGLGVTVRFPVGGEGGIG